MTPSEAEQAREAAEKKLLVNLTLEDLRVAIKETVNEGFKEAMTVDAAERFWAVGIQMLRAQAKEGAGTIVIAGAMKVLRLAFWGGLLLVAIYMVGGWSMVVTVYRALMRD